MYDEKVCVSVCVCGGGVYCTAIISIEVNHSTQTNKHNTGILSINNTSKDVMTSTVILSWFLIKSISECVK